MGGLLRNGARTRWWALLLLGPWLATVKCQAVEQATSRSLQEACGLTVAISTGAVPCTADDSCGGVGTPGDGFVEVVVASQLGETDPVANNANPAWNVFFDFGCVDGTGDITLTLFDDDTAEGGTEELLASCTVPSSDWAAVSGVETTCNTGAADPANTFFIYTITYTAAATAAPTAAPTATPTAGPTAGPTANPTANPTAGPTAGPTATPTATPTANPTATPTATPSASPTAAPTAAPTFAPTLGPSVAPTMAPTLAPTATPSAVPTASPTFAPTVAPTVAPTHQPTAAPVVGTPPPTVKPSPAPTPAPTMSPPTVEPTPAPTAAFCNGACELAETETFAGVYAYHDEACEGDTSDTLLGCNSPEIVGGGTNCRLCFVTRDLWADAKLGAEIPDYEDCPCCVADTLGLDIQVDGCSSGTPAPTPLPETFSAVDVDPEVLIMNYLSSDCSAAGITTFPESSDHPRVLVLQGYGDGTGASTDCANLIDLTGWACYDDDATYGMELYMIGEGSSGVLTYEWDGDCSTDGVEVQGAGSGRRLLAEAGQAFSQGTILCNNGSKFIAVVETYDGQYMFVYATSDASGYADVTAGQPDYVSDLCDSSAVEVFDSVNVVGAANVVGDAEQFGVAVGPSSTTPVVEEEGSGSDPFALWLIILPAAACAVIIFCGCCCYYAGRKPKKDERGARTHGLAGGPQHYPDQHPSGAQTSDPANHIGTAAVSDGAAVADGGRRTAYSPSEAPSSHFDDPIGNNYLPAKAIKGRQERMDRKRREAEAAQARRAAAQAAGGAVAASGQATAEPRRTQYDSKEDPAELGGQKSFGQLELRREVLVEHDYEASPMPMDDNRSVRTGHAAAYADIDRHAPSAYNGSVWGGGSVYGRQMFAGQSEYGASEYYGGGGRRPGAPSEYSQQVGDEHEHDDIDDDYVSEYEAASQYDSAALAQAESRAAALAVTAAGRASLASGSGGPAGSSHPSPGGPAGGTQYAESYASSGRDSSDGVPQHYTNATYHGGNVGGRGGPAGSPGPLAGGPPRHPGGRRAASQASFGSRMFDDNASYQSRRHHHDPGAPSEYGTYVQHDRESSFGHRSRPSGSVGRVEDDDLSYYSSGDEDIEHPRAPPGGGRGPGR